jgi:hypothetical protein
MPIGRSSTHPLAGRRSGQWPVVRLRFTPPGTVSQDGIRSAPAGAGRPCRARPSRDTTLSDTIHMWVTPVCIFLLTNVAITYEYTCAIERAHVRELRSGALTSGARRFTRFAIQPPAAPHPRRAPLEMETSG